MSSAPHYGVIGAGRQGTSVAWYLTVRGSARHILLIDQDQDVASRAAARINRLTGTMIASPRHLEVGDGGWAEEALAEVDVAVCALPYPLILPLTRAAISAGVSLVDLGGHTDTVRAQLELDEAATEAGVTIVPDCGMGPGMSNTLGLAALELLRQEEIVPTELRMWEGGLPRVAQEPWRYVASFSLEGLTNEYDGHALFLRDGRVTRVEALTELEQVWFDNLGWLEAFVTSGGTSTLAYSLEGVLETLENKTCRYPGHLERFRAYRDLGLFSEEPIEAKGSLVRPRDLYHTLLAPRILADPVEDVCVIRATAVGDKDGTQLAATLELTDHHQPETGFSAMERITGGHAALMATFVGQGAIPHGVRSLERTLPARTIVDVARRWGFAITERLQRIAGSHTTGDE